MGNMVNDVDERITNALVEAFNLIFDMYEEAITKIPVSDWMNGDIDYLIPARLIMHAIEVGDRYSSDDSDDYLWSKRYNIDAERIWDMKPEDLFAKHVVHEYNHEVRMKINAWLRGMREEDLLKAEERYPWTGSTLLGRVMYILAHYRQHFGEVNAELRRRGLPRIKWRFLKT
jgi:hypothetical protein